MAPPPILSVKIMSTKLARQIQALSTVLPEHQPLMGPIMPELEFKEGQPISRDYPIKSTRWTRP